MKPNAAVVPALLLAGCAALVHSTEQQVRLSTDPPGATATVDRGRRVTTPGSVTLVRERPHEVRFEVDGFEPSTVTLRRRPSALLLVDAVMPLPVFGVLLDLASGAGWALDPGDVSVVLQPTHAEPPAPGSPVD